MVEYTEKDFRVAMSCLSDGKIRISDKINSDTYVLQTNMQKYSNVRTCSVKDVNIVVPGKVVEVTFMDGTKEKSVCRESDIFSLETGISICISKKIMGGSSAYNNAVKHGIRIYNDKKNKEKRIKEEQERIKRKREKRIAYKKRRDDKRAAAEMERQIEIQKEAYLRAFDIIKSENVDICTK